MRNPTAPVASQANAGVARLSGDWIVVQGAGMAPGTALRFAWAEVQVAGQPMPVTDKGQGRLQLGAEEVWIHWLDAEDRTAALGDPAGARVWIMDRTGQPGDRLRAAHKILDWYGYDLSRLEAK